MFEQNRNFGLSKREFMEEYLLQYPSSKAIPRLKHTILREMNCDNQVSSFKWKSSLNDHFACLAAFCKTIQIGSEIINQFIN